MNHKNKNHEPNNKKIRRNGRRRKIKFIKLRNIVDEIMLIKMMKEKQCKIS